MHAWVSVPQHEAAPLRSSFEGGDSEGEVCRFDPALASGIPGIGTGYR
jgi:hypothetical protein